MDPLKVIIRKYVKNDSSTFGYFSGAFLSNQIGLTTQMPAVIEIVTNRESTKGRTVTIGNQAVRLKRSAISISRENAELLQLMDTIAQMDRYTELTSQDAIELLKKYIREKGFTQSQLSAVIPAITGMTAKKLIESGFVYEFAPG